MRIERTISGMREAVRGRDSHGFVPTMGYLHDGHVSLIESARADNDFVSVSIFVNPLQFGPAEDLDAYPRDEERDLKICEEAGVDVVFAPTVEEMYPDDRATKVVVAKVTETLEGAARPGHFDGVATVVAKLFSIVGPQRAYLGQKDAQQIAVIRRMVADLSLDVDIVVRPTVREPDGLAMSSRNAYLDPGERERAACLYRALRAGESELLSSREPSAAEERMWTELSSTDGVLPEYAAAVDPDDFGPPQTSRVLLAVAARVGPARLIDNVLVELTTTQEENR